MPTSKQFPIRVLIVDDQPVILTGLQAILEAGGFDCLTATSGIAAIQILRETQPDVILSDLNMPGMSGFELFSVVRRRFPEIALVAISGDYVVEVKSNSHLMCAYFQKGQYSPEELAQTVRRVHRAARLRARHKIGEQVPLRIPNVEDGASLLTCPECLRAFRVDEAPVADFLINFEPCPYCACEVPYVVETALLMPLPVSAEITADIASQM